MTNAGGDAGSVISAMEGKIGDLVKQAEDAGGSVPAFLKDILGNFGSTIKDSNGDLIDLTQIQFDNTPTGDGLAGMQTSLDTLQDDLTNGVPNALNDLLKQIPNNPFAGWQIPGVPSSSAGASATAAQGGIVVPFGVRRYGVGGIVPGSPSGSDTVPAWLTPGEMILNADQQRRLFSGSDGSMTVETTILLDGDVIGKQVDKYQKNNFLSRGKRRAA